MEVIKKNKLECNLEIIDVEKNPELADKYNVKAVPWVIDEDGKDMDGEVFARKCNIIDIK
jgi:thioredoxin-like negative regulator of GroEL